jgi:ribokinase
LSGLNLSGFQIAFNPAPMPQAISEFDLEKVSILIVNSGEAAELYQGTPEDWVNFAQWRSTSNLLSCEIVVTLGSRGARVFPAHSGTPAGGEFASVEIPAFKPGKVVDTTGAGDCFIGYGPLQLLQDRLPFLKHLSFSGR